MIIVNIVTRQSANHLGVKTYISKITKSDKVTYA
jgi:hypothetical protein